MQFSFLLFLLMLPEIAIFIRHFSTWFGFRILFEGSVMLVAIPGLIYSYLFIRPSKTEVFLARVAGFFLLYYLVIIFGTPIWLLASLFLLISYFLFIGFYYRFEPGQEAIKQQDRGR